MWKGLAFQTSAYATGSIQLDCSNGQNSCQRMFPLARQLTHEIAKPPFKVARRDTVGLI